MLNLVKSIPESDMMQIIIVEADPKLVEGEEMAENRFSA